MDNTQAVAWPGGSAIRKIWGVANLGATCSCPGFASRADLVIGQRNSSAAPPGSKPRQGHQGGQRWVRACLPNPRLALRRS